MIEGKRGPENKAKEDGREAEREGGRGLRMRERGRGEYLID